MEEEHYLSQIKKCITFIFILKDSKYVPLGTGFFVNVIVDDVKDLNVTYLVTAKHVLQLNEESFYPEIYLRLNTHENTALLEKFPLFRNTILTHPDDEVDVVCIPIRINNKIFDFKSLPNSYFADSNIIDEKKISEGDNIFYAGLFFHYYGNQKNQPLIRFGKVSSLTNEKVEIKKSDNITEKAHLYFFECQTLGGFSGSPVFFQLDRLSIKNQIRYGNPEIYLAGIMKGHYRDFVEDSVPQSGDNILRELNLGISAVTPCYFLQEILFSPAEIEYRKELINKYRSRTENQK